MVVSTVDACPVCFLFAILVMSVRSLVLLGGGFLALCVIDLVFCAGGIVIIVGL